MDVASYAPARALRLEIAFAQVGRQVSKSALFVNTLDGALDRPGTGVAGYNLDRCPLKPSSFVQSDSNRQRFLAGGAGSAPYSQRRPAISSVPLRHQCLNQRPHLIDLSPEVRLLNR